MSRSPFILIFRLSALLCWVAALYLFLVYDFWYVLLALLLLHTGEVIWPGYKLGKKAGYSGGYSILMTLIFGFTWWLYLDE